MTTDPTTADYLRTIVRSQVMTDRARDLLLKMIDDMQNELACRPVTAPKVEIRMLTDAEIAERDRGYSGPALPYTGPVYAQDPPPECNGGCSRGGEGPSCGKPGCY